ncbi:MAG: hypothetical protein AVDCRST_MAG74-3450 [uncultured Pyrinomonadaceae bacterium]|uniref:Uncharacterized protein n=1 Tax=uncultured Pyrinomonadaceae bacterium TaxID=2283094 RepID=A0A6J4PW62_9BACT|nr:MAG: hypothetical protein AVDCRST_MAG74-3450 [uncultured Pyrinomonadaceae bacterium]
MKQGIFQSEKIMMTAKCFSQRNRRSALHDSSLHAHRTA